MPGKCDMPPLDRITVFSPSRGDGARDRLAERIAALHGRLRRQIGVDVDRQHRIGVAEMGQRNADRVVDLGGRGEGRIEILPVELAHQLEADLARDLPVEFAAGEVAGRLAADMHGERRRRVVEELLGVIVGEDDPEVGLQRPQPLADLGRDLPHVLDVRLVLGVRHGEELRRMGQHRAADHGRHHGRSPRPRRTIARIRATTGHSRQQARTARRTKATASQAERKPVRTFRTISRQPDPAAAT